MTESPEMDGMGMTMAMTGMTGMTGMHGGMDMGGKKHHMWMWFHTTIGDTILFDFWNVETTGEMVYSCFILFFAAIALELTKWMRWRLEQKFAGQWSPTYFGRLLSLPHILQCILFTAHLILGYLLMLAFMTFSIWVGIAISAGAAVGYLLFGIRPAHQSRNPPQSEENCCG